MALPLEKMALAYSRWGRAAAAGDAFPSRTVAAVRHHPHLLGGTERFDTIVLEETHGDVITKVGAEGVHCASVPGLGFGLAVKVEDGAIRAQHVAVLRLLQLLGALPEALPARLQEWAVKPIRNTRGEVVGEVRPDSA
jgi:L-asparaginase II